MRLPDFEAWAIFAAVADANSFTEASRSLGLSKGSVSKAVTRLEAHLGQSLFHRTSRRLALTEAGMLLADHARRIVAEAHAAEEAAHDAATIPTGRIRLAAPMSFGIANVAPLIATFLQDHPGVEIDLHLSDAKVDIVAEGFDVALRIGDLADSSLRARRLCDIHISLVAAPAYLELHGMPAHPADLARHRMLGFSLLTGPLRFRRTGEAEVAVRPNGPLLANSGDALVPTIVAGLGLALLPGFIIGPQIASGALVEVLPDWAPPPIGLHVLTPPSPLRPARVDALIAFLAERLRDPCANVARPAVIAPKGNPS